MEGEETGRLVERLGAKVRGVGGRDASQSSKQILLTNKGNKTERGCRGDSSPVYSPRTTCSLTRQPTRVRLWCLLLSVRDQYFKRPIKEEIELGID